MKNAMPGAVFGVDVERRCRAHMEALCAEHPDPSHDILHVNRVLRLARELCEQEGARWEIVGPATYLHDCVYVSKTDARRAQASRISSERAVELLRDWGYDESLLPDIAHAIEAHSFSAGIVARTKEAQIVQDADRLDAMGFIGAFRCFAFSGLAGRPLYSAEDPFCEFRTPDDKTNTLDHFFVKLLKLSERLQTPSAQREGERRNEALRQIVEGLRREI